MPGITYIIYIWFSILCDLLSVCLVSKVNLIAEQVQEVEHRPKALKIHLGRLERFLYYLYLGSCRRQKIIRRESISSQLDRYVKTEINFSFYNKLLQILFEIDLLQISLPQNWDKIETKKRKYNTSIVWLK